MREKNADPGAIPALLLFLFVCGGCLFLLYEDAMTGLIPVEGERVWSFLVLILFLDGLCAASLCASLLLPMLTWLLGVFSASGAGEILTLPENAAVGWRWKLLLLLLLVPVHFVLCTRGMSEAAELREALRRQGLLTWKKICFPYAALCVGPAAVLLLRYMGKR